MKKLLIAAAVTLVLGTAVFAQTNPTPQLKVGDTAPDFTLSDTNGTKVKLSDLRSKHNVVLAFYVFAFTGG